MGSAEFNDEVLIEGFDMATWSGTLYDAGTLLVDGNSGWLAWSARGGTAWPGYNASYPAGSGDLSAPCRVLLRMEPADLATDETLAVTLALAFDSAGTGSFDAHVFTTVTATNVAENVVLPGEESTGILTSGADLLPAPLPEYFKLSWVLGGTPVISMTFVIYAAVEVLI